MPTRWLRRKGEADRLREVWDSFVIKVQMLGVLCAKQKFGKLCFFFDESRRAKVSHRTPPVLPLVMRPLKAMGCYARVLS